MSEPSSTRIRGECRVMFAYDVAQAIDLNGAAGAIRDPSRAGTLGRTHPAPMHFQFAPPPLRVLQRAPPLDLAGQRSSDTIELVLFDFGAVIVSYSILLDGTWGDMVALSCELANSPALEAESRRRAEQLVDGIAAHVTKRGTAGVVEDYSVFRFASKVHDGDVDAYVARHGAELAQVLRAEQDPLSKDEIADALSTRLQYGPRDLALLDWHAAILFDDEPEDVTRVLEYANAQLLEMRFLDAQLDTALEGALRSLPRRGRRRWVGPLALRRDLARLSSMQVEAAFLFERLSNTLKVSGDQYLARVLRQAGARFRLREWNEAAQRKLGVLDNVYDKLHDHASTLRAEMLEWLIVVLIVVEIVLSLVGH